MNDREWEQHRREADEYDRLMASAHRWARFIAYGVIPAFLLAVYVFA